MTYHAPFCVKPFGPTRLEVARLLAGGFLQEGTFIGVQDFKDVRILPNTNHLPLLGPTPTLDGTLEKHQKRMHVTWWKGDKNIKGSLWGLPIINSVRMSPGTPGKCYWLRCHWLGCQFSWELCVRNGEWVPWVITGPWCWSVRSWCPLWETDIISFRQPLQTPPVLAHTEGHISLSVWFFSSRFWNFSL